MKQWKSATTLALALTVTPLYAADTPASAPSVDASAVAVKATSAPSENAKLAGIDIKVNINDAAADELATLLAGVGLKKARAIVQYRTDHGKFNTADELANVRGIGLATVEKNRSRIEL
jgi:competence protein ComEA